MLLKHIEKQVQEVEVIDSIVCNCCGEKIASGIELGDFTPNFVQGEYIDIYHQFGYFSKVFVDSERHHLQVCEKCYANWLKTFKYAPEGFGENTYFINDPENFENWKSK